MDQCCWFSPKSQTKHWLQVQVQTTMITRRRQGTSMSPPAAYPPTSFTIILKRISATSVSALAGTSVDVSDRTFSELRTQAETFYGQTEMHVDHFYTEASGLQFTEDQPHHLEQVGSFHLGTPLSVSSLKPKAIKSRHRANVVLDTRPLPALVSIFYTNNEDTLLSGGLAAVSRTI